MYRRIYGKAKSKENYSRQNFLFLEKRRQLLARQAAAAEATETSEAVANEASPPPPTSPSAGTVDDRDDGSRSPPANAVVAPSASSPSAPVVLPAPSAPSRPRTYGSSRRTERAHERDIRRLVEDKLDEETRRELEEVRSLEKERAEKARIEADRLAELKEKIITVESVNEHINENAKDHHTDSYECTEEDDDEPQLVVRRGQEFKMTFTFQRPYDKETDDLFLVFTIGGAPNPNKKTAARIQLRESEKATGPKKGKWGARILSVDGNAMQVAINTPADAVIGEWEYGIRTRKDNEEFEFEGEQDFVLLLNPWCPDDQVYMEDKDALCEYILNEAGAVFSGNHKDYKSRPWTYGQFRRGILEICLRILRLSNNLGVTPRMSDPVYISRALSRILNNCDDNGVLAGRWDGKYEDGVRPLSWHGSPEILEQYHKTGKPVKYGQCWVFSHLLTTVSRALGLPCRSVTNFASAHDTDGTMTIDKYIDDENEPMSWLNHDSVWNFHVWNEVWMHRPDLDQTYGVQGKYDGWQAVDATPQEVSDGVFQCGPSPLSAIKLGEVGVGHDTVFVFGEINAEQCTWRNTFPPNLVKRVSHGIGKCMSTKYPDGKGFRRFYSRSRKEQVNCRLDVTNLYKEKEGSTAERAAVSNAVRQGVYGDILFENKTGMNLTLEDEDIPELGEDFTLTLKVENVSDEAKEVKLKARVRPANYWGSLIGRAFVASSIYSPKTIQPGEAETYSLEVKANDYIRLCGETLLMKVLASAEVEGSSEPLVLDENINVEPPEIQIEGPSEGLSPQETYELTVTYKNPTQVEMTKCELKIDGSVYLDNDDFELINRVYHKKIDNLGPGETVTMTLKARPSVKPRNCKDRELTVTLASKEVADFEGSHSMDLA